MCFQTRAVTMSFAFGKTGNVNVPGFPPGFHGERPEFPGCESLIRTSIARFRIWSPTD